MIRTLLFTGLMLASSVAGAAPASKFLGDAIRGDNSEIRLGRVIAQRGNSGQVRAFGTTLVRDHSMARAQAAALARAMHVPVPASMMSEAHSEMRKLERMRGPSLDREVRRYMVDDHRNDIAKFEAQVRNGDRRTAALARAQLPTLRKHLRIAESLPR